MLAAILCWGGQKLTRDVGSLPTDPVLSRYKELTLPDRPPGHTELWVGALGSPGWAMFNTSAFCSL